MAKNVRKCTKLFWLKETNIWTKKTHLKKERKKENSSHCDEITPPYLPTLCMKYRQPDFLKSLSKLFFFLELLDPFLRWGLSDGRRWWRMVRTRNMKKTIDGGRYRESEYIRINIYRTVFCLRANQL